MTGRRARLRRAATGGLTFLIAAVVVLATTSAGAWADHGGGDACMTSSQDGSSHSGDGSGCATVSTATVGSAAAIGTAPAPAPAPARVVRATRAVPTAPATTPTPAETPPSEIRSPTTSAATGGAPARRRSSVLPTRPAVFASARSARTDVTGVIGAMIVATMAVALVVAGALLASRRRGGTHAVAAGRVGPAGSSHGS